MTLMRVVSASLLHNWLIVVLLALVVVCRADLPPSSCPAVPNGEPNTCAAELNSDSISSNIDTDIANPDSPPNDSTSISATAPSSAPSPASPSASPSAPPLAPPTGDALQAPSPSDTDDQEHTDDLEHPLPLLTADQAATEEQPTANHTSTASDGLSPETHTQAKTQEQAQAQAPGWREEPDDAPRFAGRACRVLRRTGRFFIDGDKCSKKKPTCLIDTVRVHPVASSGVCVNTSRVPHCKSEGAGFGPLYYRPGTTRAFKPRDYCSSCTCGEDGKMTDCHKTPGCLYCLFERKDHSPAACTQCCELVGNIYRSDCLSICWLYVKEGDDKWALLNTPQ